MPSFGNPTPSTRHSARSKYAAPLKASYSGVSSFPRVKIRSAELAIVRACITESWNTGVQFVPSQLARPCWNPPGPTDSRPAAISFPRCSARPSTRPPNPAPRAFHSVPVQSAMFRADTPATSVKMPPAYSPLGVESSAKARPLCPPGKAFPTEAHSVPVHLSRPCLPVGAIPAAQSSRSCSPSRSGTKGRPSPIGSHDPPVVTAMLVAATPPISEKLPPAYRFAPMIVTADTNPVVPPLRSFHSVPSHKATLEILTPPAFVIPRPPIIISEPHVAMAWMPFVLSLIPEKWMPISPARLGRGGTQLEPFHLAKLSNSAPARFVNLPPIRNSP